MQDITDILLTDITKHLQEITGLPPEKANSLYSQTAIKHLINHSDLGPSDFENPLQQVEILRNLAAIIEFINQWQLNPAQGDIFLYFQRPNNLLLYPSYKWFAGKLYEGASQMADELEIKQFIIHQGDRISINIDAEAYRIEQLIEGDGEGFAPAISGILNLFKLAKQFFYSKHEIKELLENYYYFRNNQIWRQHKEDICKSYGILQALKSPNMLATFFKNFQPAVARIQQIEQALNQLNFNNYNPHKKQELLENQLKNITVTGLYKRQNKATSNHNMKNSHNIRTSIKALLNTYSLSTLEDFLNQQPSYIMEDAEFKKVLQYKKIILELEQHYYV